MATIYLVLTLVAAATGWATLTDLPATGKASYYNPGVMATVWQNRLAQGKVSPCPECIGAVAMLRQPDIGRKVWVEYKGEVLGPFMVVDCAGPKHYQALVDKGEIAELPYWLAQRWNMADRIGVVVRDRPPESNRAGAH